MRSLETLDVIVSIPNDNAVDSGADSGVNHTVEPFEPSNLEQHSTSTSQVDSDTSDSTSVVTGVETIDDHTTNHIPSSLASEPITIIGPKSINLEDLVLHSPSSQILGTPFANDNTRFEYPFPDTTQTCSCGAKSSTATSGFFNAATSSSPSSNSFPTLSTSQILTQPSLPPLPSSSSYNATHPKMKVQANPPVPPNLIKRRLRWSLSLLNRRRSSTGSQQSVTSDESTIANTVDGHGQQAAGSSG